MKGLVSTIDDRPHSAHRTDTEVHKKVYKVKED
jgi:hypothetical protein